MKKIVQYKEYIEENGIELTWENAYNIMCMIEGNSLKILANKQGLLSLANHLITLAQDTIPSGNHLHFDEYNSLDDDSKELIICKM